MSRGRLLLIVVLSALVVAAAVLTWSLRPRPEPPAVLPQIGENAGYRVGTVTDRDAVHAAVVALPLALSYSYSAPDQALEAATSWMTPAFAQEYRATFDATVRPMARTEKAITQARVRAAGVVTRHGDRVTCLLYVDQVLASSADLSAGGKPVKVGQNRVLVQVVRVGRSWKVDDITPL